jgi:hypothetical protein
MAPELQPDTTATTKNMAHPRARLRLFAFKMLNCMTLTRADPERTGYD